MASKTQLTGGNFQDSEGNALALGKLRFHLNQDATVTGVGEICSGIDVIVNLNSSGAVDTVTPQYIWANDQMLPANTFYTVYGYAANGELAWGPNAQQVTGSGGTFDVGTWVPNQVVSWTPTVQTVPITNNSGTFATAVNNHIISDTGTIGGGGTVTVTILSALQYSGSTAYSVVAVYTGSSARTLPITVSNASGTSFTVTGDAGATFAWVTVPKP